MGRQGLCSALISDNPTLSHSSKEEAAFAGLIFSLREQDFVLSILQVNWDIKANPSYKSIFNPALKSTILWPRSMAWPLGKAHSTFGKKEGTAHISSDRAGFLSTDTFFLV